MKWGKKCRQKVKWVRTCATNSRQTTHTCDVCTRKKAIKLLLSLVQRSEYLFRCILLRDFFHLLHTTQYEYHQRGLFMSLLQPFHAVAMYLSRSLYLLFFIMFFFYLFLCFQDVSNFLLSWCVVYLERI